MIIRRTFRTMALAALACLLVAPIANAAQPELRRIEAPPAEGLDRNDGAAQFASYDNGYQPSVFRFAEFEAEAVDHGAQPTYGGEYGCCCQHYGSNLAIVGGLESTFLFPLMDSGNATVIVEDLFNGFTNVYRSNEVKLDDDVFFSPRMWVGLQHCSGWGINTRLFWLGDSDSMFTPDTPFFLQSHQSSARLQAYSFDAELTKGWCNYYGEPRWAAFGYRHANLEIAETVEAHAQINGDFVQGFANTESTFKGSGFTFAYGGSKGTCSCGGCELFFKFRGSFLFGDIRKSAQTTAWAFDPSVVPGTANNFSTAVAVGDDVMFIGEIQLGVKWEHQLQCCCARAFLSTAVEYQYWNADDANAAAGSVAFTNDARVTALATANDLELHMIGLTIGTGLVW